MDYRDYQQKMHDEFAGAWASGAQNVLGVLPTGGGKSALIAGNVNSESGPTCSIAHRQELVSQISLALGRFGIPHRLIAADSTIRNIVRVHMETFGRSFYDPRSRHGVASVDTLVLLPESDRWLPTVKKWVVDECFPAGTMVGDTPIERVRVGDSVPTFDEATGEVRRGLVTHVFESPMPDDMVRLTFLGHHVVTCTPGHPVFTRRGWVAAAGLLKSDEVMIHDSFLLHMQNELPPRRLAKTEVPGNGPGLLREGMQHGIPGKNIFGDDGTDQQGARLKAHEGAQPHAPRGNPRQGFADPESDRACPERAGREREGAYGSGAGAGSRAGAMGVSEPACGAHQDAEGARVPYLLQAGLRELDVPHIRRGGRAFARDAGPEGAGRQEGRAPRFVRLDSVAVLERGDPSLAGASEKRGSVFNLEVDGTHTYLTNGLVVHNCHHLVREGGTKGSVNKWMKAINRMPLAKGLGLTATPLRADGKGLGRFSDGVMDVMIQGPEMRELIQRGYLTDYEVYCPPSDIDLSAVGHSGSGDFSPEALRKAVHGSRTIVGDVVSSYLRLAPGKRGVTFCVDIEAAQEVCAEFRRRGVPAEVLTGKTPDLLRAQILRGLRDGRILQVVSVDVLSEGFDLPAIEVVSFARPTDSLGLYRQQFGRVLRTMPGKAIATVIDHVGNVVRHRPPDALRAWSLDRRERKSKGAPDDLIPMRSCPQCTRPYERTFPACPFCGHVVVPAERSAPQHVDGDLVLLTPDVLAKLRGEIDAPLRIPYGATPAVEGALRKHHSARNEAQAALRAAMDQWAGYRVAAGEADPRVQQRRFFLQFGVDVLSAQALPAREANELRAKIEANFHA